MEEEEEEEEGPWALAQVLGVALGLVVVAVAVVQAGFPRASRTPGLRQAWMGLPLPTRRRIRV